MLKVLFILVCLLCMSSLCNGSLIIGIAGGTGSGKTTLAERLAEELQEHAIILSEDAYYRDLSHLPFEERKKTNFDHLNAIDFTMLKHHLAALKQNQTIEQPIYDFKTHSRRQETRMIYAAPIVIVEGILLLAVPTIREQLDLKIFVDVDDDVRVLRRIDRDMKERGREFNDVRYQYLETVRHMHRAFVEPSKQYADLIVPMGGHNEKAFEILLATLKRELIDIPR